MSETTTSARTRRLLTSSLQGEVGASSALIDLTYEELLVCARRYLSRERDGHTLQPTALVNEAYLRLFGGKGIDAQGRTHFKVLATRAMRRVLIDYGRRVRLPREASPSTLVDMGTLEREMGRRLDVAELHEVLGEFRRIDPTRERVVELRCFGGLDDEAIATALGVSSRTIRNYWRFAKAWLRSRLHDREHDGPSTGAEPGDDR